MNEIKKFRLDMLSYDVAINVDMFRAFMWTGSMVKVAIHIIVWLAKSCFLLFLTDLVVIYFVYLFLGYLMILKEKKLHIHNNCRIVFPEKWERETSNIWIENKKNIRNHLW